MNRSDSNDQWYSSYLETSYRYRNVNNGAASALPAAQRRGARAIGDRFGSQSLIIRKKSDLYRLDLPMPEYLTLPVRVEVFAYLGATRTLDSFGFIFFHHQILFTPSLLMKSFVDKPKQLKFSSSGTHTSILIFLLFKFYQKNQEKEREKQISKLFKKENKLNEYYDFKRYLTCKREAIR